MNWISIKDQLPEYNVEVLGFLITEYGRHSVVVVLQESLVGAPLGHLEWWSGGGITGFDADIHPGTITHWAEIDPPYV